jgi:hypothetical protein
MVFLALLCIALTVFNGVAAHRHKRADGTLDDCSSGRIRASRVVAIQAGNAIDAALDHQGQFFLVFVDFFFSSFFFFFFFFFFFSFFLSFLLSSFFDLAFLAAKDVFFTGEKNGVPGVFRVPFDGSTLPVPLAVGAPFVRPRGIAFADSAVVVADEVSGIFAFSSPTFTTFTSIPLPNGVTGPRVVAVNAVSFLFASFVSSPSIFILSRANVWSEAATLPLQANEVVSGIVVSSSSIFAAAVNSANQSMRIFQASLATGQVQLLLSGLVAGGPIAGLAIDAKENNLLISSLESASRTAQVLLYNFASQTTSVFNSTIGSRTTAGGLQRALFSNNFVWSDLTLPSGGVYRINLRA